METEGHAIHARRFIDCRRSVVRMKMGSYAGKTWNGKGPLWRYPQSNRRPTVMITLPGVLWVVMVKSVIVILQWRSALHMRLHKFRDSQPDPNLCFSGGHIRFVHDLSRNVDYWDVKLFNQYMDDFTMQRNVNPTPVWAMLYCEAIRWNIEKGCILAMSMEGIRATSVPPQQRCVVCSSSNYGHERVMDWKSIYLFPLY